MKVAVEKLGRLQSGVDVNYMQEPEYFFKKHIEPNHKLIATLEF